MAGGDTGYRHMTHVATAAVRHALLDSPAAAYDTLVASLAWRLIGGAGAPALRLEPKGVSPSAIPKDVRLDDEADWEARRRAWRERLPRED